MRHGAQAEWFILIHIRQADQDEDDEWNQTYQGAQPEGRGPITNRSGQRAGNEQRQTCTGGECGVVDIQKGGLSGWEGMHDHCPIEDD